MRRPAGEFERRLIDRLSRGLMPRMYARRHPVTEQSRPATGATSIDEARVATYLGILRRPTRKGETAGWYAVGVQATDNRDRDAAEALKRWNLGLGQPK
ncbi:MAG TPA: hypothetical protein VLF20_04590 [Patescibacteria group bacterium]|nr:hypothetical protein [Patescibacteria group bacterium]